jgi:hypothetical protein
LQSAGGLVNNRKILDSHRGREVITSRPQVQPGKCEEATAPYEKQRTAS